MPLGAVNDQRRHIKKNIAKYQGLNDLYVLSHLLFERV
jgi:hypothetical protein